MMSQYEKKLIEEKDNLLAELNNIALKDNDTGEWQSKSTQIDESEADPTDHADRFEDFEEKSSLIVQLSKRLQETEKALARISNGTYGRCAVCGGPIETERLNANPSAETCIMHIS